MVTVTSMTSSDRTSSEKASCQVGTLLSPQGSILQFTYSAATKFWQWFIASLLCSVSQWRTFLNSNQPSSLGAKWYWILLTKQSSMPNSAHSTWGHSLNAMASGMMLLTSKWIVERRKGPKGDLGKILFLWGKSENAPLNAEEINLPLPFWSQSIDTNNGYEFRKRYEI